MHIYHNIVAAGGDLCVSFSLVVATISIVISYYLSVSKWCGSSSSWKVIGGGGDVVEPISLAVFLCTAHNTDRRLSLVIEKRVVLF